MDAGHLIQTAGKIPVISHALRWYAGRYPEDSVVKIKHGCAAGSAWRRHHRYVNGYWIGHYELPLQQALTNELDAGQTFFDIGANAGFFTLVAARRVGSSGRCVAFDPSPDNAASIREQLEANALDHCRVVEEAISEVSGTALFSFATPGSPTGHLGTPNYREQRIEVKVTTLDLACARFGKPDLIKMDIEGGEINAFKSAGRTLSVIRPRWLIELHGAECEREVKRALQTADYEFFDLRGGALNGRDLLPGHFIARPAPR